MPLRLTCVLALALAFGASAALAQDDDDDGSAAAPIVVRINGPCALVADGRDVTCSGVAYMAFPANHRIDFTAITGSAGVAFSGTEDDNQDGHYTLEVDSLLHSGGGRTDADGECDMQVAEDRRTVKNLTCRAATDEGVVTLKASGAITAGDDSDDDDGDN